MPQTHLCHGAPQTETRLLRITLEHIVRSGDRPDGGQRGATDPNRHDHGMWKDAEARPRGTDASAFLPRRGGVFVSVAKRDARLSANDCHGPRGCDEAEVGSYLRAEEHTGRAPVAAEECEPIVGHGCLWSIARSGDPVGSCTAHLARSDRPSSFGIRSVAATRTLGSSRSRSNGFDPASPSGITHGFSDAQTVTATRRADARAKPRLR